MKLFIKILILLLFFGCEDFLDKVPHDRVSEKIYYRNSNEAITAVNAVYDALQGNSLFGLDYPMALDIASDNSVHLRGERDETQFGDWNFTTDNGILFGIWSGCYRGINRANIVLEKVPNIDMDQQLKDRLIGEAKFLRALYYHILVRMFGDVPLIIKVQDFGKYNIPKNSKEEIYTQIIMDLKDAETALPTVSEYNDSDLGRATQGAAQAYLSKVYLYMEDWSKAAEMAKKVIDSNQYGLLENFGDNYKLEFENSMESIFEVQFQGASQTGDGASYSHYNLPASAPNVEGNAFEHILPTENLVNSFDTEDKRRKATLFMEGDDFFGVPYDPGWSETGYSPAKYVTVDPLYAGGTVPGGPSPLNFHIMRYSEVLLIYAEALNELSRTDEAYQYINQVRERAGLNPLSGLTKDQFREALYKERRLELVQEADRVHDLVRTGRAAEVLVPLGFTEGVNEVFPIPFIELERNPLLTQNTGY